MSQMELRARAHAVKAHAGQRYGDPSYSCHLDQVAELAKPYGEDAVVIAFRHDAVEDTAVSIAEIESKFGARVAASVSLLTNDSGFTRKERMAKTHARQDWVAGPNEIAHLVKAADRLANVPACVKDRKQTVWEGYRSEQAAFRAAAYRPGLCNPLLSELETLLLGIGFGSEA